MCILYVINKYSKNWGIYLSPLNSLEVNFKSVPITKLLYSNANWINTNNELWFFDELFTVKVYDTLEQFITNNFIDLL
jgi:hypothetical protein